MPSQRIRPLPSAPTSSPSPLDNPNRASVRDTWTVDPNLWCRSSPPIQTLLIDSPEHLHEWLELLLILDCLNNMLTFRRWSSSLFLRHDVYSLTRFCVRKAVNPDSITVKYESDSRRPARRSICSEGSLQADPNAFTTYEARRYILGCLY
jgi:hypothetical protein